MRSIPHTPRSPLTTTGTGRTVNWLLETRAATRPNHPFLVWEPVVPTGRTWTYAEFARDVAAIAEGLRIRGVGTGTVVLIHLENCPEYILTWFACARIGAIVVCTNTRSSQDELSYFGSHSGASVVVTQPSLASLVSNAMPGAKTVFVTDHNAGDPVAAADLPGRSDRFAVLLGNEPGPAHQANSLDPALVLYTSGTTGRPKAVTWTHGNTMWAAKVNGSHVSLGPIDVTQVFLPLFHTNAQSYSILSTLWAGGTVVLQPRFSASRFWDVAQKHNCTFASQVNFPLRALANRDVPSRHSFTRWASGVSGGPAEKTFNVPIVGWYGMSETVSAPIVGDLLVPNRAGTIGRAASQYEIAVVDSHGNPVDVGETGDLRVRGIPGVSLFGGYLHDEAATMAAFDEHGWFITGDCMTVHEDGFLSYAGRGKDMLRVGGENVAASEIERVILGVPGVVEAAVVAGPDPMLDEVPVAFVVARPATAGTDLAEAVLAACRQDLADFKVPREVRFVDNLPRATLEKVAKHELRKLLRSEAAA
jgi:carnitine-CoA ligase